MGPVFVRPYRAADADATAEIFLRAIRGYLDMMFVHPHFQGLGVATLLLKRVQQEAEALGLNRLHTEASITVRPFFERRGFIVVKSQQVEKRGETFANFLMEKLLPV